MESFLSEQVEFGLCSETPGSLSSIPKPQSCSLKKLDSPRGMTSLLGNLGESSSAVAAP